MTECRFCNEPIHLVGRWWELTEVSGDTYCPYGRECRVHESCPPECSSMTHEPAGGCGMPGTDDTEGV